MGVYDKQFKILLQEYKLTELPKREVNVNYTLLIRYNGVGLIFSFKGGLSLIIRRLSVSYTNFPFSLVSKPILR